MSNSDRRSRGDVPRRDRGVTFVEMLVAVVLLGTVVVAVVAALSVAIRGSVTQDDQVKALSVLEEASSALKQQGDCGDYESRARAAVDDPEWAALLVVSADCTSDPDFHRVVLTANAPRGLQEQITILVGGPRVLAASADDGDEEEPFVVVPCAVTSATAMPTELELEPVDGVVGLGVLPVDVNVTLTTDVECQSAYLRAQLVPTPLDNLGAPVPPPPFRYDADTGTYVLPLEMDIWRWQTGAYDVDIELVRSDTEVPITTWSVNGLFELTCSVEAFPSTETPTTSATSNRLADDLLLTVIPSTACPVPSSLSYSVDTGFGIATGSFGVSDGTWTSDILGDANNGPEFTPGPKLIEIVDDGGAVVTTIGITVGTP